jgi:hypothetical protein
LPLIFQRPLMASSLPVIYATDDELTSHALVVAEVEKASGGKAVWRIPAAGPFTDVRRSRPQ